MSLADEINRLFRELVHGPWSQPATARRGQVTRSERHLDVEMPISGGQLGDIAVVRQGREMVVRVRSRSGASERQLERSIVLPESVEVSAIEVRITDGTLHVRLQLRTAGE
jgi:HSP20 family molecular chaperone IbpA